ncbi:hypothetical protein ACUWGD_15010 [Bacillus velezensis]|uniref:hypothetical protein n=1 Tax=Bacillus velezensis TaxID=492670 RepID=UPI00387337A6
MTMLIAVKFDNSIVMTADKRVTTTNSLGRILKVESDEYKKIKIINKKYVISFAGRMFIAEKAFDFIDQKSDILNSNIDPLLFFREAFNYGKSFFEAYYSGINPLSVFFVGYIKPDERPQLLGFSSDNNYLGLEIDSSIKINSNSPDHEDMLISETVNFISTEMSNRHAYHANERLLEIYSEAIKRTNDPMIGKTTYSVILTSTGAEEYHH